MASIKAHMLYISRRGELAVEDERERRVWGGSPLRRLRRSGAWRAPKSRCTRTGAKPCTHALDAAKYRRGGGPGGGTRFCEGGI